MERRSGAAAAAFVISEGDHHTIIFRATARPRGSGVGAPVEGLNRAENLWWPSLIVGNRPFIQRVAIKGRKSRGMKEGMEEEEEEREDKGEEEEE